jgi:opacity protein-like surface antigen
MAVKATAKWNLKGRAADNDLVLSTIEQEIDNRRGSVRLALLEIAATVRLGKNESKIARKWLQEFIQLNPTRRDILAKLAPIYGGFAGYNFQSGATVYGMELAYSTGNVRPDVGWPIDDFHYGQFIDAKARIGFAVGNAPVYGVAGWTMGKWNEEGYVGDSSGFNAGVGLDYLVTSNVFIGA